MQGRVGRPEAKWATRRELGPTAPEAASPTPGDDAAAGGPDAAAERDAPRPRAVLGPSRAPNPADAADATATATGEGEVLHGGSAGTPDAPDEGLKAAYRGLYAVVGELATRAALPHGQSMMLQVGLADAGMADGWIDIAIDIDGEDEFEIFASRGALEHRAAQRAAGLGDREPMLEPILHVALVPDRSLTPALRASQSLVGLSLAGTGRRPHPVVRRLDTMFRPQPVTLADVQRAAACLAALAAHFEVEASGLPVWDEPPSSVPLRRLAGTPHATVREHLMGFVEVDDDEGDAMEDALVELQNFVESDRRLLAERDAASALYFGHLRQIDDDMSEAAGRFEEWFCHERAARGLRVTPAAAFCRRQRLSGRAGELARCLAESRVAALEVVQTTPGVGLTARALPGDEHVRLIDRQSAGVLRPGHLIVGRIYSDGRGAFHPSSVRVTLGADARPAVIALLARHGGTVSQRHLEPLLEDGDTPPPSGVPRQEVERRLRLAAKAAGLKLSLAEARARVAAAASAAAAGAALLEGPGTPDEELRWEIVLLAAALWEGLQNAADTVEAAQPGKAAAAIPRRSSDSPNK